MSFQDFNWIATLTGNVVAECWGSGGGGAQGNGSNYGSGGGGAAYARKAAMAVISSLSYTARVADAPPQNTNGDDSFFSSGAIILARGGRGAVFGTYGAGGLASACIGDVKFSGGDGYQSAAPPVPLGDGGGGGGAADDSGDGNVGTYVVGGAALPRGGVGGNGGLFISPGPPIWLGSPGDPGGGPGGGGGGGSYSNPANVDGGDGGRGAVVIWDMADWPDAATPGTRPRLGAIPLASYGATVPPFPSPSVNRKIRSMVV